MAIGTAAAILGSAIIGGGVSMYGAKKASDTQEKGARNALAFQQSQYQQGREDLAPYRDIGKSATTTLGRLYGLNGGEGISGAFGKEATDAFRRSPDYEFARQEGGRIQRFKQAGMGQFASGNTLRELATYNQGLATQNFGNYAGRLMHLAGMGQNAASQSSGQAGQFGNAGANLIAGGAQASASGTVGMTNAFNSALGSATNNMLVYNMNNRTPTSSYQNQPQVGYPQQALPWQT